jgi:hypothetical protein
MNFQKESVNRQQIGRSTGSIVGATPVFVSFGPFTPGEYISALRCFLQVSHASDNALASVTIRLAVTSRAPRAALDEAEFLTFRPLTPSAGVVLPLFTNAWSDGSVQLFAGLAADLPVSHVVDGDERFLVVSLLGNDADDTFSGSLWIVPGHSNAHDREE